MNRNHQEFGKANKGTTLIEYSILIGAISLISWGALAALGNDANSRLAYIATCKTQTVSTANPKGIAGIVAQGFGSITSPTNNCVFNTTTLSSGSGSSGSGSSGSSGGDGGSSGGGSGGSSGGDGGC